MEGFKLKRSVFVLVFVVLLSGIICRAFADDYRIKAGDTLGIAVMDEQDLTKHVTVDPQGNVTLPLVNQVNLSNMTLSEATTALSKKLAKFIKSPQVSVELLDTVKVQVTVSGEVKSPGIYTIASGARAMDAITQAGGYTQNADLSKTSVTHSGGPGTVTTDLNKFLLGTDTTTNVLLAAGDTIVVPSRQTEVVGVFSVIGAVRQPGEKTLTKGITFTEALMMAGGPTELADTTKITIRHQGSTDPVAVNYVSAVAGDKTANPELIAGDVVYIEPKAQLGFYTIQGGVTNPGRYELKDRVNLSETIAIAGGIKGKAKLNKVRIVRISGGTTVTLRADVSKIMEGTAENIPIQNGDSIYVPATDGSDFDYLRLASVLASIGWLIVR